MVFFGFPILIAIIGGTIALLTHDYGLDTKATTNIKLAESRVAMNVHDKKIYSSEIKHLIKTHKNVGNYTIQQILDMGNSVQQSVDEQSDEQNDAIIVKSEYKDMDKVADILNERVNLIQSFQANDASLEIVIDTDIWGNISNQDQTLIYQSLDHAWAVSYNIHHHSNCGCTIVYLKDEAGNKL